MISVLKRVGSLFQPGKTSLGLDINAVKKASKVSPEEIDRYLGSNRIYLETSAFNHIFESWTVSEIEQTREYQRRKGTIFVTSPIFLWEIMRNADRRRADKMLLAAQALFDPLLLATPTELIVRYLRCAYPHNRVNFDFFSRLEIADHWRAMTEDFERTISYDFQTLKEKTQPIWQISKNLKGIFEGEDHILDVVRLSAKLVSTINDTYFDDLRSRGADETEINMVALYALIFLFLAGDWDGTEAGSFREETGALYGGFQLADAGFFADYAEIFFSGPLLEMARMAALQYRTGHKNRGTLLDGMHMIYAPYVNSIISNDAAFFKLVEENEFYRGRVFHLSELQFRTVEIGRKNYPEF